MSPSDILPPNKHIFHASCRAKKDIFLAYCVPALMTWPPLEDADVWCLAEICEWLVSLTPACLVPFHPLTIYNMSLFKFSPSHNIQCVPFQIFTPSQYTICRPSFAIYNIQLLKMFQNKLPPHPPTRPKPHFKLVIATPIPQNKNWKSMALVLTWSML